MTCHRRVTFMFAIFFSIATLFLMFVEILPPLMLKDEASCFGIVYDCTTCPQLLDIKEYTNCRLTEKRYESDGTVQYKAALALASLAGGLMAIFTIVSIIFGAFLCCPCCGWRRHLSKFVITSLVIDVVCFACNVASMALWAQMLPENFNYGISFYVGWAANGAMLILFIVLLLIKVCGRIDAEEEAESLVRDELIQGGALYRDYGHMIPSTVLK